MKKIPLAILLICAIMTASAQKVAVKLNTDQKEGMRQRKVNGNERLTSNIPVIDKVLEKHAVTSLRLVYPLAVHFDHPAKESVLSYYYLVGNYEGSKLVAELKALQAFDDVFEETTPTPTYIPNDFALADQGTFTHNNQWALTNINAQAAWNVTTGNSSVKIAILDNGFNVNHEELATQYVYSHENLATGLSHGTRVAGVAAGATDNGVGLSSIGFNSKMMFYLFNTGESVYNKMLHAQLNGAKVISLSWIQCVYRQPEQDIVNMIVANGTTIVASAGNGTAGGSCFTDDYAYPASYDNVISVSGTDYDSYFDSKVAGQRFTFNDKVDLTAPAYYISTATAPANNSYAPNSGTSFAAPLVAGTAALMYSVKSCLTPYDVEYILEASSAKMVFNTSAYPENAPFVNTSGAGRLDAFAAVSFTQVYPAVITNFASTSGPALVCTTGNYSLSKIPQGASIQWSCSPTVSIVGGQGTSTVTVSKNYNGAGWVKATLSFPACGQSVTFNQFDFWVGTPIYQSPISGPSQLAVGTSANYTIQNAPGSQGNTWSITSPWSIYSSGPTANGSTALVVSGSTALKSLKVTTSNACGSHFTTKSIQGITCSSTLAVSPNPSKKNILISVAPPPPGCGGVESASMFEGQLSEGEVVILNDQGHQVYNKKFYGNSLQISDLDFPSGLYYIRVRVGNEYLEKRHAIE